jgi:Trk K+ transport system NAD-binding subunit
VAVPGLQRPEKLGIQLRIRTVFTTARARSRGVRGPLRTHLLLAGRSIREETGCTIIPIRSQESWELNPHPDPRLSAGMELIPIGAGGAEKEFICGYPETL